jgi:hypothetical protein
MNYTALPLQGNRGKMYIFRNNITNALFRFPSLSAVPPVYENDTVYMPGDMLTDDLDVQTKLYTAFVKTTNNPDLSEDWQTEEGNIDTPLNYVNVNDRYSVANGFLTYKMTIENSYPIVILKNSAGDIIDPKIEILPGDFYTIQIDMRQFPEGFYSIHIDSDNPDYHDDLTFYLLQQREVPFGLIEIVVKSNQAAYNLTNMDDLLSPTFELRFRNRRTHWRYSGKIFDTPYVHGNPLPLTRFGHIEIVKPPVPGDVKTITLPNPSENLIVAEALINTEEKKYYSEIHIN